ncbi:Protein tyrosine phosphatase domain-containing protein 1 [Microtus ochrogaster]|uniref:Protein tyrosine phosphatase domain-containing protein 1 n=1 Tax=Microtus ochrogaster TaxID=79684 RepID=A0A8J6GVU9_MICOH|nr:Protein tyrosine phosphatase domain-containing protein 1 [Microtus ochrogaster]
MQVQDPSRRPSAVHFLSAFLQGRRHSTSDPVLRLQQARRSSGSATKLLSSSSIQVMVAVSSVSRTEGNPTFPERKKNSERPTPKYTKVGERLRHVIPGHMACSMACGGRACKYENPARWSEQEQAIKGVYSSWVTDSILAMARPSSEVLEKYHIIEQFLGHGIKTIINLQRPGEHASCGNSLEQESGFTYLPEAFMEAGIYFYNFGWKDYGVASLTAILDMVKVMTFALQEGKVAVHCHAGLGRTAHAVTLAQYLIRQRHLLHGYEARLLKHVPKIIHLVCKLLLDLAENRPVVMKSMKEGPGLSAEIEKTVSEMVTMQLDQELLRQSSDAPDPFHPTAVAAEFEDQDVSLSNEHDLDPLWKRRNAESLQPLTHLKRQLSYSDSDLKRAKAILEQGETPWTVPAQDLLDHSLQQQKHISHCYMSPTPELGLNKEALVHSTFSFWTHSKCGGLEGLKDEGSPLFCRKDIPKEVQRSRTFSVGVSCSHNPGEPVPPNFASIPRGPEQVTHCRGEAPGGWVPGSVQGEGRTPCSPLNCGSSSPKAQFPYGQKIQDSTYLSEAMPHTGLQSELSAEARRILAAKALANLNEFVEKEEVKRKVEMWQEVVYSGMEVPSEQKRLSDIPEADDKELNSREGAWERICGERDPFILCSLMWSWVEQLKEPVITKEDVDMLVDRQADAGDALFLLEKVNFDSENGPIVYNTLKKIFKHTLEEKRKMAKDSPRPGLA